MSLLPSLLFSNNQGEGARRTPFLHFLPRKKKREEKKHLIWLTLSVPLWFFLVLLRTKRRNKILERSYWLCHVLRGPNPNSPSYWSCTLLRSLFSKGRRDAQVRSIAVMVLEVGYGHPRFVVSYTALNYFWSSRLPRRAFER